MSSFDRPPRPLKTSEKTESVLPRRGEKLSFESDPIKQSREYPEPSFTASEENEKNVEKNLAESEVGTKKEAKEKRILTPEEEAVGRSINEARPKHWNSRKTTLRGQPLYRLIDAQLAQQKKESENETAEPQPKTAEVISEADWIYGNDHLVSKLEPQKAKPETKLEARKTLEAILKKFDKVVGQPKGKIDAESGIEIATIVTPKQHKKEQLEKLEAQKKQREEESKAKKEEPLEVFPELEADRQKVLDAESKYLAAYKKEHRDDMFLARSAKRLVNAPNTKELAALKKAYFDDQFAYGELLRDHLIEKMRKDGVPEDQIASKAAYLRYKHTTEVAIKNREAARKEGLSSKQKNGFDKFVEWTRKTNEGLEKKYGKTNVKIARVVATAAIITGGAAGFGAFATTGALAALGFGGVKLVRGLAGITVGSGLASGSAAAYDEFFGKNKIEQAKKDLDKLVKNYKPGTANGEALHQKKVEELSRIISGKDGEITKNVIRASIGFLFGVGAAGALDLLHSDFHVPSWAGGHTAPDLHHPTADGIKSGPGHEAPSHASGSIGGTHESISTSFKLEHPGEGADQFFHEFKEQIAKMPGAKDSPMIKFIESTHAHKLTQVFKFPNGNSEGYMQPGDTLQIQDGNLVFIRGNHHLLLASEKLSGSAELSVQISENFHEVHEFFAESLHHAHHAAKGADKLHGSHHHKAESSHSTQDDMAAENAKTAQLNQEQAKADGTPSTVRSAPTPSVAPVEAAPVERMAPPAPVHEAAPQDAVSTPTPTPAPEHEAPVTKPEAPTSPPDVHTDTHETHELIRNAHGLEIDPTKSVLGTDHKGFLISAGGSVKDRLQKAIDHVNLNHKAVVYLDSSTTDASGHIEHHVTRVFWDDADGLQAPNETMDPSLQGLSIPSADEIVKIIPN